MYRSPNKWKRQARRGAPCVRRLPDRWIDYDPVGKDIPGTRFVAFKTPLRANYFMDQNMLGAQDIFETKTLFDMACAQGKKIGLVIDLTATDKYYDSKEWTEQGVQYAKIRCAGHEAHNQLENVHQFYNIVTNFLRQNNTGDLIGVHCTHGLNRTGYMICRYLIEIDGWDADSAIEEFEYCRGYRMERKKYLDSLRNDCIRGKYSDLSVSYIGKKYLSADDLDDQKSIHLKNTINCIDLADFVARG